MVPVKRPGRPLSSCPHPTDQPCNCGGVTAAIPRKQACHCGTNTPVSAPLIPLQRVNSLPDPASPTQPSFKVQKTASKPLSSRRSSFDPANLDRMDLNQVNIVASDQHAQRMQAIPPNPYHMSIPLQPFGFGSTQYVPLQPPYIPLQMPLSMHGLRAPMLDLGANGYANGLKMLDQVLENPLETSMNVKNGQITVKTEGRFCCAPSALQSPLAIDEVESIGGSCCVSKRITHSHSSSVDSTVSEPPQITANPKSCCSSKSKASTTPNSQTTTPLMNAQSPQNGFPMNNTMYPQYPPTVFTYPATYGSYQNPLQPSAWRQGVHDMSYGQVQGQPSIPTAPLAAFGSNAPLAQNLETIHTCSCGDGCQCVGCAAHPYNDATRQHVLSAWGSMQLESDVYSNSHANGPTTGHGNVAPAPIQDVIKENTTSPPPATPSSTASGNAEEQSLSASDFFFVNYPLTECGGDDHNCPCGDDCQCLGCTIHRVPDIPCSGEKDTCPCGDECVCLGCTIHNL